MDKFVIVKVNSDAGDGDASCSSSGSGSASAPKKQKRLCLYRSEWEKNDSFSTWLRKSYNNPNKAFCKVCCKEFSIGHGGESDLKQHASSKSHKENIIKVKQNNMISTFLKKTEEVEPLNLQVIAAEVTHAYHIVSHHQSYLSNDCMSKLFPILFPDSKIANSIACGRTKAEAIIKSVLAPASLEFVRLIKEGDTYFSIASDASNKGTAKTFPICVRYWSIKDGIQNKLLDFYEDPNETSDAISGQILNRLASFGLKIKRVSAYSADNASVNFGIHHSVYQSLKERNPRLLAAGCPAHMCHNSAKHACNKLKVDVETVIIKIYNYIKGSGHSKRVQEKFSSF